MTQNDTANAPLSGQMEQAALHIAANDLTDSAIADALGISRASISRWKRRPEFQNRVRVLQATLGQAIVAKGIAERQARVDALNDRWERMRRVIDERAADGSMEKVPGGTTGLIVRQWKQIGAGKDAQTVEEYSLDAGLLRELRAHEQQAAQELGQWTEKRETTAEVNIVGQIEALLDKPIPVHLIADPNTA